MTFDWVSCAGAGPPEFDNFTGHLGQDELMIKFKDDGLNKEVTNEVVSATVSFTTNGPAYCKVDQCDLKCTEPDGSENGLKCQYFKLENPSLENWTVTADTTQFTNADNGIYKFELNCYHKIHTNPVAYSQTIKEEWTKKI